MNFVASGVTAAIISYLFGLVTLRVRGSAFIIMTVSFLHILHLLALNLVGFTQGQMGIGNIAPARIFGYELLSKTAYYYLVFVVCGICIYTIYKLVNSRIGRAWITIKENEALAKSVGVNVLQYANLAFVIGAFFAGLGGSLYAHYVNFVSPDLFLFLITTELLVMMIMGGKGTVVGPVVGAVVFSMLPEYLRMAEKWRLPIFGAILIVGILFLPNGLVKLPNLIREWRAQKPQNQGN
jgi:branched-chain amino acid transport system permease protein